MSLSTSTVNLIRANSKDETAFEQLIDLFERSASAGDSQYRVLAENFPDGIVALLDRDLRFIVISGQGLNGSIDAETIKGRRFADVFSEDIAARDEPHVRAALAGEARTTEVDYLGRFYRVHTLPVRDQNGGIFAAMVVTQDITARYLAEQAEREARLRAEEANQLKLHFLAMISHELRTPLASIKGFSSTLLAADTRFTPEAQHDFIRIIDEEADRLTGLVNQLLDLSRLEAGMLSMQLRALSLPALVDAIGGTLQRLTAHHPIQFQIPDSLPLVRADGERLKQVFANLIENAAKHSPPQRPISIDATQQDAWVQVNVTDEGPGIDPSDRLNVFEPFLQLPDPQGVLTKGAGLGLAICKGIIEAQGGAIWIEDTATPGTTVSFTLPLAQ